MVVINASAEIEQLGPQEAFTALFLSPNATRAFHLENDGDRNVQVGPWSGGRRVTSFQMPLRALPDLVKKLIGTETLVVLEKQELVENRPDLVSVSSSPEPQSPAGSRFKTAVRFTFSRGGGERGCRVDASITCTASGPWGLISTIEGIMASQAQASVDLYLAFCQRWCRECAERVERGESLPLPPQEEEVPLLTEGAFLTERGGERSAGLQGAPSVAASDTASLADLFFDAQEGVLLDAAHRAALERRLHLVEQQVTRLLEEVRRFRLAVQPDTGLPPSSGSFAFRLWSQSAGLNWLSAGVFVCGAVALVAAYRKSGSGGWRRLADA